MVAKLDCDKINRIADGVGKLSARFDAIVVKDAAISISEYKRLVREREEAKQQLIDWTEAQQRGERVNLTIFEKKYTATSEALAAAQMKMTEK
jgi:hypothetical protein